MTPALWLEIERRLKRGDAFALATIVTSKGSTPGGAGAKMLVTRDGLAAGTLGGGSAEAEALDAALRTLKDGIVRRVDIDMSGEAAKGADLICGGKVSIFIQRILPEWSAVFLALCDQGRLGRESFLLTPLSGEKPELIQSDASISSSLPGGLSVMEPDGARLAAIGGKEYMLERISVRSRLILAGGGHVSLATARMAVLADFDVTVIDDRIEFANPERFSFLQPERIHVIPDFIGCLSEAALGFPVTDICNIAILTRGHSFDGDVLRQSLKTRAGYIGMIGSTRKRDSVYAAMRGDGFTDADLGRVHCPIGLPLGGKTPGDIAVSIVAEVVSIRAKKA